MVWRWVLGWNEHLSEQPCPKDEERLLKEEPAVVAINVFIQAEFEMLV